MTTAAHPRSLPSGRHLVASVGSGSKAALMRGVACNQGPYSATVRIIAAGLCGTQVHQLRQPRDTSTLLGHEAVGEVIAVGPATTRVDVGDRVLVSWLAAEVSRPVHTPKVLLDDGRTASSGTVHTLSDVVVVDEAYLTCVPEQFTELSSVALAVVGCAVLTGSGAMVNVGRAHDRDTVAVIGVGGIGGSAILAAHAPRPQTVIAIDLDQHKADLGLDLGADIATSVGPELVDRYSGGVDLVIDTAGTPQSFDLAWQLVRRARDMRYRGGRIVLVGAVDFPLSVSNQALVERGVSLIGCLGGGVEPDRDIPLLLDRVGPGLENLITDTGTLDEAAELLEQVGRGQIRGRAVITFE